ncbi:MAG: hypothetical protein K2M00_06605, partial [Muribaculaceae bacterium]|nr:hypothetical protein [Muribaculaceae bacterium]
VDDSRTCLFIDDVTPGVYTFSYEMTAATAGNFASGPVTVQSQYAPELNARSGSTRIIVKL